MMTGNRLLMGCPWLAHRLKTTCLYITMKECLSERSSIIRRFFKGLFELITADRNHVIEGPLSVSFGSLQAIKLLEFNPGQISDPFNDFLIPRLMGVLAD